MENKNEFDFKFKVMEADTDWNRPYKNEKTPKTVAREAKM